MPGSIKVVLEDNGGLKRFNAFFKRLEDPQKVKRAVKYSMRDFMRSVRWWAIKGLVTSGSAVGQKWDRRVVDGEPAGIRSGNYLRAIENMSIQMRGDTVVLKFRNGDMNRKSRKGGLTMKRYISIFEYGSKKQPPRPLWAPAWQKAGGNNRIIRNALRAIQKDFNHAGFNNIKIKTTNIV
jgi:hypothetical protein